MNLLNTLKTSWQNRDKLGDQHHDRELAQFLPAALEIQATPPHPIAHRLTWSLVILFALGITWACLSPVNVVASAEGKIIPSSRVKQIQPLEKAVVKGILVTEGQLVKQGDPLVELDNTLTQADQARLSAELEMLQRNLSVSQGLLDLLSRPSKEQQTLTYQQLPDFITLAPSGISATSTVTPAASAVTPAASAVIPATSAVIPAASAVIPAQAGIHGHGFYKTVHLPMDTRLHGYDDIDTFTNSAATPATSAVTPVTSAVIPAQAGIHGHGFYKTVHLPMDTRLHGYDDIDTFTNSAATPATSAVISATSTVIPATSTVIPAQAGIHRHGFYKTVYLPMDTRLYGYDDIDTFTNSAATPATSAVIPAKAGIQKTEALYKQLLWQQWQQYWSQHQTLKHSLTRNQAEQAATRAQISKLEQTLPIIQRRAEKMQQLRQKQYASEEEFLAIEQQRIEQTQDLSSERQRLKQLKAANAEIQQQVQQLLAQTQAAELAKVADYQGQVAALQEELTKAQDLNAKQVLYAPVDGRVKELAITTVGGVVTEAQQLMLIVPDDEQLHAEVFLDNKDIGFVFEGMTGEIKVHTFPFTKYGIIGGDVITVSDDAIFDEKRGLIYSMRLLMKQNTINVEGKTVKLIPGMAVTAEIQIGHRRIIEFFLAPLLRYKQEGLRER